MARIVEHLPVEELEARCREARHATGAIRPLAQERTVLDVAGVLAFAPRWVEELAASCNASGPEGAGAARNGRTASMLTGAVLGPGPMA